LRYFRGIELQAWVLDAVGKPIVDWQRWLRLKLAVLMAISLLVPSTTLPVSAETGDRTLYLYHTHTGETARITFKRNGVYDPKGLQQLDWFLRDFRNNQPTEMAPQLFDLVWEVYQKVGATQPINIVSAYRSPSTNAYLRSHSNGVANNSQHMLGHAMDWFVPGVPLTRLRAVAMQQQVGGVGFYPTSGSPFVHTDVGTVRAWPRMTTAQLQAIFPDGKTMHVPTNGALLSQAGYAYAQQQWNACHAVPCTNPAALRGGAQSMGFTTMTALATTSMTGKGFADIHSGVDPGAWSIKNPGGISAASSDDTQESADDQADPAGPAQTAVASVTITAPVPMDRPADLGETLQVASVDPAQIAAPLPADPILRRAAAVPFDRLFPDAYAPGSAAAAAAMTAASAANNHPVPPAPIPMMPTPAMVLARNTGTAPVQSALGAIASVETSTAAPGIAQGDTFVTAYAASIGPGTHAEHTMQAIIESETTGAIAMAPRGGTALTNSLGSPIGADALTSYAADRGSAVKTVASIASNSFTARDTHLIAPGFDTSLAQPVAMSSGAFAVFVQPAATDLDPATELGAMMLRLAPRPPGATTLSITRFGAGGPFLVASR
jgi:uncharacterized protein YcbK (DUF882 family)